VQSIGYALVAVIPLMVGIVHDLTASWTVPLVALAVVIVGSVPAGIIVARPHTVEEEWGRRHGRPW
jgi:CP family cyanate transporter-like MFS transporter